MVSLWVGVGAVSGGRGGYEGGVEKIRGFCGKKETGGECREDKDNKVLKKK